MENTKLNAIIAAPEGDKTDKRDKCKHAYNELNKTIIVKPKLLANLGWKIDSKPSVNPKEPGNPQFFLVVLPHNLPPPHA